MRDMDNGKKKRKNTGPGKREKRRNKLICPSTLLFFRRKYKEIDSNINKDKLIGAK